MICIFTESFIYIYIYIHPCRVVGLFGLLADIPIYTANIAPPGRVLEDVKVNQNGENPEN